MMITRWRFPFPVTEEEDHNMAILFPATWTVLFPAIR
jgi:hypothetical protein